jgi:hypothetical protein
MKFKEPTRRKPGEFVAPKPIPRNVSTLGLEASWKALERRNFKTPGYPNLASKCAKDVIERDDVCPQIRARARCYLMARFEN